jgi:hypothetical protein
VDPIGKYVADGRCTMIGVDSRLELKREHLLTFEPLP